MKNETETRPGSSAVNWGQVNWSGAPDPTPDQPASPTEIREWQRRYFAQWPLPQQYLVIRMWWPHPDWCVVEQGSVVFREVGLGDLYREAVTMALVGQAVGRTGQVSRPPSWTVPDDLKMARADVRRAHRIVTETLASGRPVVVHNGVVREIPFLERQFARFGLASPFGPDDVLDVGMLAKASKISMERGQHESARDFFARVLGTRTVGVRHGLADCCHDIHVPCASSPDVNRAELETHLVTRVMAAWRRRFSRPTGSEVSDPWCGLPLFGESG